MNRGRGRSGSSLVKSSRASQQDTVVLQVCEEQRPLSEAFWVKLRFLLWEKAERSQAEGKQRVERQLSFS